ncbi:MAG: excinuclease ABC subunit UvrC [Ruminococcaceae bacterium]|nr:excinuclease ABC subunit UvrC [Oscillospiraceae bacterium]
MAKESTIEYLRKKALLLPKSPGVYIMEDKSGKVIYVGKSRALKNRVTSYFHGAHNIKTEKMVSHVADFRYITCDTEMEALVLENNLIKQYTPKYNILLKDAKSYPYIKVTTNEDYPRVVMTRKRSEKGTFFGPYSGTSTVQTLIATIEKTLGLPSCKKKFPEDIGKGRPCVYRQIGRCCGLCAGDVSRDEYGELIKCAIQLLKGNTRDVEEALIKRMMEAAEAERFEEAARCRDAVTALKKLSEKQKTQLSPDTECDIVALASHEGCDCAAVLYVRGGMICDSEYFMFGADEITGADSDDGESPFTAFLVNLYTAREYIPKEILLSFEMPDEDRALVSEYLSARAERRVTVRTPVRGEGRKLCLMAEKDAVRHSETRRKREDTEEKILVSLAKALSLEVVPERIEAYDISNIGSEHITAGMIVSEKGRLKKSDYRYFRIKGKDTPDDYGSMRETILRRLSHLEDRSDSSFSAVPDLILLDGGATHVAVVREIMREAGYDIPVFGMVKDDHHKTRTLVTDTEELSIARDPELFRFIYKLQEEVHRFTVSRMTQAKRKTLKTSSLEKIKGIGPAKAKRLLLNFGSVSKLKEATAEEIRTIGKVSEADAEAVFEYFNKKG